MWKKMRALLMAGALCVAFAAPNDFGCLKTVMAKELQGEMEVSEEAVLQLLTYDVEADMGLAVVSTGKTGMVTGDGVRLRSDPSASGAILEKMYTGEYVMVRKENGGWYNVQRLKTGTVGWVSKTYIVISY